MVSGLLLGWGSLVCQVLADTPQADMPWLPPRKSAVEITQEEWDGMKAITERYPAPKTAPGVSDSGKNYYARYGDGLSRPKTWADVTPGHLARRGESHLALLCDMPRLYFADPTEKGRENAKQFFLEQVRLTLDKEDKNSGSGRTYQIVKAGFHDNVLAMKDVLKEEGLYDDFARVWSMHKRFMLQEHPMENMDWTRDRVSLAWALTANMDDGPEKLYRLRLLQRATSMSYDSLVTSDGGAIHHGCDHISYASYSMDDICDIAIKAYGTPFQLSDATYRNLKAYAWVHGLSTIGTDYPGNLQVRVRLGPMDINVEKWLPAMADMTCSPDPLLAGMYMTKFRDHTNGVIAETVERYRSSGVEPVGMNAHHSYNIASAAIHRRGDWLVTIDGCRNSIKAMELYTWAGTPRSYMPNSVFGSIQILSRPHRGREHGYVPEGWDHNHYAGVTAPVLPYELLMTQRQTEQIRNGSRFGGGTSLGPNGVWGLIFNRYGQELCRKSAFCFDNRITVLTSDIQPLTSSYGTPRRKKGSKEPPPPKQPPFPTHTTLFQFALPEPTTPMSVNGKPVTAFPYASRIELSQPVRLRDHRGNGYFVHAVEGDTLRVARRTQHSYNFSQLHKGSAIRKLWSKNTRPPELKQLLAACEPIPGDFGVAWIEHHPIAERVGGAFTIFVQDTSSFSRMPYTILRQDRTAHILRDMPSQTTGYVVFEPNEKLGHGALRMISRPSTVMIQETGKGELSVSISSTDHESDVALLKGVRAGVPPYVPEPIVLTLAGAWRVGQSERDDLKLSLQDGTTRIIIPYLDYMPVRFGLEKK